MNLPSVKAWLQPGALPRQALTLLIVVCGTALLLTDLSWGDAPLLNEGDVPDRDIIATKTFTFIDQETTTQRQQSAQQDVPPVFVVDSAMKQATENTVAQAFDMARSRVAAAQDGKNRLSPELSAAILRDFNDALNIKLDASDGQILLEESFSAPIEALSLELIDIGSRYPVLESRQLLPAQGPILLVSTQGGRQEETQLTDLSRLRTQEDAWQAIGLYVVERLSTTPSGRVKVAAALARALVKPDCFYDEAETEHRRITARNAIQVVEVEVRKGKKIVRMGDPVTARQAHELEALRNNTASSGSGWMFLTHLAFAGVIIASTVYFAKSTIRKFAPRPNDMEAMAFSLLMVLGIGRGIGEASAMLSALGPLEPTLLALLVPVAGGTMLVRVLINSESALIFAVVSSLFASVLMDRSSLLMGWYLVTSLVAATAVGQGRERAAVLRAGLQAALIGTGLVVVLMLTRQEGPGADPQLLTTSRVLWIAGTAMLAGFFSAVLALGVVPAFELLGFITDYKLLELSNLNHPLLRQLMLKAPGTYHHSVIVGSLSEAACEAIGANALLARVACYFHDIGKGVKPQYFVENQREGNRHDRLAAVQSAQVIINHVRDGHLLALQYRLPKPITDNIFMHHGTGLIQYFYNKAKEQAGGEPVDEALFRYPGPKPDTREAGIIMLADKVEAACRTIKDPDEARIRAMIQKIINSVMVDGQFENCPLTLKEVYQIADTFTGVLLGIYHHRIEYPDTRAISSGKGKFVPVPRQGTITLEIINPLKGPPPPGSASTVGSARIPTDKAPTDADKAASDYERLESLPGPDQNTLPPMDDS